MLESNRSPAETVAESAEDLTPIFRNARAQIEGDIDRIVSCLDKKRSEMFAEIDRLEREFVCEYQLRQDELSKLRSLQTQTGQLCEGILAGMQSTIARELEAGIGKLELKIEESKCPGCYVGIKWGMCLTSLISQINSSDIVEIQVAQRECEIPIKTEPPSPRRAYRLRGDRPSPHTHSCKRPKRSPRDT